MIALILAGASLVALQGVAKREKAPDAAIRTDDTNPWIEGNGRPRAGGENRTMKSFQALCTVLLVVAATLSPGAFAATPGVSAGEIVVGNDVDLSGPIAVRMKLFTQAADAYVERVNKGGGIHGRQLRIVRTDSGNKPDQTKANVKKLVEQDGVFAMWGISGTGNVAVALPYLAERGVPLIGSTSGADPFYVKTHPTLINVKAGYGDEIRRIMDHLRQTYVSRVGIIHLDNGFGKEALKTALAAAQADKVEVAAVASAKEDGSDLAQAAARVAKADPPAVLLLTLAGPAPKMVEAYLAASPTRPTFFALSIVASDALYKSLGDRARGIVVTQVVPFPWDRNVAIVREYQDVVRAKGASDFSTAGMEGFVAAKALVEGLQAAGRNPTRDGLLRAYEQMRDKDLGGLKLSFAPDNHNGSRFVEITMIGREGKLVR